MAYEAVRQFETLPRQSTSAPTPDYIFFRPAMWVICDPEANRIVVAGDHDRARDVEDLAAWLREVRQGPLPDAGAPGARPPVQATQTMREFCDRVERAKEYILDGDIFQVVLSLRHDVECDLDPLCLYARLRALEPHALRYCYLDRTLAIVGASPEPLINAENGNATIRLLAGTAARGSTAEEDREREAKLRGSHKDLAEHRMLVDLARNDLGRVAVPGSVRVTELMEVEYYSRVMHLASETVAELEPDAGIDRVVRSTFPAGTMTGTPKIRAMEIIDELEPVRRGIYSGAFGLLAPDWLRMYLAIRTMVVVDGVARVQAGAGIVADSSPSEEYTECLNKMRACLTALGVRPEGAS
jgi:anthranilate synthase component 1